MNSSMASLRGPGGDQPDVTKERFCRAGNTPVALSPASSRRAGATSRTEASPFRDIFFTAVNGCKNSRHWVTSISPRQYVQDTSISRLSKVRREDKNGSRPAEEQKAANPTACKRLTNFGFPCRHQPFLLVPKVSPRHYHWKFPRVPYGFS